MRNLVVVSLAVATLACGTAFAADLKVKAPIKAPPPATNWTGCYIGPEGGGIWTRESATSNGTVNGVPNGTAGVTKVNPFEFSGVMVGGELGCNYQFSSNFVFGIEGTFDITSASGRANLAAPPFIGTFQDTYNQRWLATVRGRLGYLWDPNTMFFVTGGVAWADFRMSEGNPAVLTGEDDYPWGWTVGAGLEYMFPGTRWSAKAEYMYIHFQDFTSFAATSGCCTSQQSKADDHIFKIGLNYHFGWLGGPVAAKY
jgi:outer membrane immunogenic protein